MKMEKFVKLMTGHFDNREQFTEMKSAGKLFPYARHVNTVCNDKINNIPIKRAIHPLIGFNSFSSIELSCFNKFFSPIVFPPNYFLQILLSIILILF